MSPAKRLEGTGLLSLPEDLLNDIGILLDDKDACMLELASRTLCNIICRPSCSGPGEHLLDLRIDYGLGPCSSNASRSEAFLTQSACCGVTIS